jgi:hypothetical protein
MAQHPDELDEPIHELCELLDLLDNDLNRAPQSKRSHKWYRDRLAERNRLAVRLQALKAEQEALALAMDDATPEFTETFRTIEEWATLGK